MNQRTAIDWSTAVELTERRGGALHAARAELATLRERRECLQRFDLSDTEWALLLELYVADATGRLLLTKSLFAHLGVPLTTKLRYILLIEEKGLAQRTTSETDRRITLVSITPAGRQCVRSVLGEIAPAGEASRP